MSSPTDGTTDPTAERHWICARRLRARRRQLGMTQAEVVRIVSHRGAALTNRALSAMEHGRGLDLGRLPDLAVALDCTVTYLIGLTEDPARWEPDPPDGLPAAAPTAAAAVPGVAAPGAASGAPTDTRRNWILGPEPSWSATGPHRVAGPAR